jgi:methylglyoxal synthase
MPAGAEKTRHENSCNLFNQVDHWQATLGIVTCKRLRDDQGKLPDEVVQLLCGPDFAEFLKTANWQVAMTGGTYGALQSGLAANSGNLLPLTRSHRLPESALGVIQLANLVVYGFCSAILFFNEMDDYYADSPQNLCLRRICNHCNVPLIEDFVSIRYMLEQQWYKGRLPRRKPADKYPAEEINQYLYGNDKVLYAKDFEGSNREDRSLETLAIVSHDGKKMDMLTFCLEHIWEILSYRRVLATGTSGQRLRDLYAAALKNSLPGLPAEKKRQIGWRENLNVDAYLDDYLKQRIHTFKSGPDGGDIQISSKIIDGTCHRVIFFQDPTTAHPHQFDIRLMEKAAQDRETGALFATSEHMARLIV